jgi:hypothetical protein
MSKYPISGAGTASLPEGYLDNLNKIEILLSSK